MVGERIQAKRPFSSPVLELEVTETPFSIDPASLQPEEIGMRTDTIQNHVIDAFDVLPTVKSERSIKRIGNFTRGTTVTKRGKGKFTVLVNVENADLGVINRSVNELEERGYKFGSMRLK